MTKEELELTIQNLKDESNGISCNIFNLEKEKYLIDQEIENLERELQTLSLG